MTAEPMGPMLMEMTKTLEKAQAELSDEELAEVQAELSNTEEENGDAPFITFSDALELLGQSTLPNDEDAEIWIRAAVRKALNYSLEEALDASLQGKFTIATLRRVVRMGATMGYLAGMRQKYAKEHGG